MVEDSRLLPPVQATPAGLPGAEPQLQGQELPGYVVVEDEQDALETEPVRDRPRPRRPFRPRRQQRLDQRPQVVVHDPRPSSHTITNSRIVTPVTANQDDSARSCYELIEVGSWFERSAESCDHFYLSSRTSMWEPFSGLGLFWDWHPRDGSAWTFDQRRSTGVKRPPDSCAVGVIMGGMNSDLSGAPTENTHIMIVADGAGLVFTWDADARIEVPNLGREVVIEANAAGLRTLAGHLLVWPVMASPMGLTSTSKTATGWRTEPSDLCWSATTRSSDRRFADGAGPAVPGPWERVRGRPTVAGRLTRVTWERPGQQPRHLLVRPPGAAVRQDGVFLAAAAGQAARGGAK
ncbi:hypothetical protein F610DRAFT_01372 [Streptomyces sp. LaPpAH-199]|nr:hypothetical protein F610DRAFT_01372 [Streptomyces sp. LaPpAH-199]